MRIFNTRRKFGAATEYVDCYVNGQHGLLTQAEANRAIARFLANPEDIPTWWDRLLARIFRIKLW